MEKLRGHSILFSSNTSREPSAHSDVLSMDYADQVQALANNQTWVEQVESRTIKLPIFPIQQLRRLRTLLQTRCYLLKTHTFLML